MAVSPLTYKAQQPAAPIQQYFIEEYCSDLSRANPYKSHGIHSDFTNSDRKPNNIVNPTKPPLQSKRTEYLPADIFMEVQARDFHAVKPGKFIDGPLHDLWGFQWFLRLYPKGPPPYNPKFNYIPKTTGSTFSKSKPETCALYLCLDNLHSPTTIITINFRLYCHQTTTSCTEMGTFSQESWYHGFHGEAQHLRVSKLDSDTMIQIGCRMNVLHITNGTQRLYSNPIELLHRYTFQWQIPSQVLRGWMQCPVGKRFESKFYCDGMWNIHVYPKGTSFKTMHDVLIAVQQCIFPQDISSITVRVQIECVELYKLWSAVYELSVDHNTTKLWPVDTLKVIDLNGLDTMTLKVEVTVIEQHESRKKSNDLFPRRSYSPSLSRSRSEVSRSGPSNASGSRSGSRSKSISSTRSNQFRVEGTYSDEWYQNTQRNKLLLTVIRALFGRHCIRTEIKRSSSSSLDKVDLMKLIRAYYPWHVHEWTIRDTNTLRQILVARNKQKFESDVFEIGGFKWYFKIYPVEYMYNTF